MADLASKMRILKMSLFKYDMKSSFLRGYHLKALSNGLNILNRLGYIFEVRRLKAVVNFFMVITISLVFFYIIKLLFAGFFQNLYVAKVP